MSDKRYLTKEDKEIIIKEYPYKQTRLLAEELGVTVKQVNACAYYNKVKKDKDFKTIRIDNCFSFQEIDYIYENYPNMTNSEIARNIGHTSDEVSRFARNHKLTKSSSIYKKETMMSPEHKKFILENYSKMRTREMSEIIHESGERIRSYAYLHGLRKDESAITFMCYSEGKLTNYQKEYIIKNYSSMRTKDIANELGITYEDVHGYASGKNCIKLSKGESNI